MSDDLGTLQGYLAVLERNYFRGVLSVRQGDTSTTFQDMPSMKKAIDELKTRIAAAGAAAGKPPRRLGFFYPAGKGL